MLGSKVVEDTALHSADLVVQDTIMKDVTSDVSQSTSQPQLANITPSTSHSSNLADNQFRFFCFILGHSENSFSVKVEKDTAVEELRNAIIDKARLININFQLFKPPQLVSVLDLKAIQGVDVEWQILYNDESLQQHFNYSPQFGIHVVIQLEASNHYAGNTLKRKRSDSPYETDGERKKRSKELLGLSEQELQEMEKLYEQIHMLSEEPTKYSDPNEVFDLPFPSMNEVPPRFSLSDEGRFFYIGREYFSQVWKMFGIIKRKSRQRQAIYVYGGKGFGKSYILAALACLLICKGAQVVYIPDCRAMLLDPLSYLRTAIVFAFINSPSFCEEILKCEDLESLANFCARYRQSGQLCFIIDQVNALDLELMGQDEVSNTRKNLLRDLVQRMSSKHILITSASANHKTYQYMAEKDIGDRKVHMMRGMTSSEMSSWWKHHNFVAFSDTDKQRVEDLTGCIPLLLNPFVKHHEKTLASLEPRIWVDEVLESVRRQTIDFAKAKKLELHHHTAFRDEFLTLMRNCLLGVPIAGSGHHMDRRFFYIDSEGCGRYSCGLARQAITEFLWINAEEEAIFLGPEWYDALITFKNNPSVIGFTVEQIVISKIVSAGLRLGDFNLPRAQISTFDGHTTRLSIDKPSTYYVPLRFNLKAIDLLFASIDVQKKTAHVVPIQITVAKQHKDSEAAFFADWDTWCRGLEDFEVKTSFLWIHHGIRGRKEVEKKLKELKSRAIEINRDYEVLWVSIEQIDVELEKTLTKIRQMS